MVNCQTDTGCARSVRIFVEPGHVADSEFRSDPRICYFRLVDDADDLVMACKVWQEARRVACDPSPLGRERGDESEKRSVPWGEWSYGVRGFSFCVQRLEGAQCLQALASQVNALALSRPHAFRL